MSGNLAPRPHRLLYWACVPMAVFAVVFAGSLAWFELDDDGRRERGSAGAPAGAHGAASPAEEPRGAKGRLAVTYSATPQDPGQGFLGGVALDGSDLRNVLSPPGGERAASNVAPAVAPDGVTVAFQRAEAGPGGGQEPYIYLMPLDGSKPERRLTRGAAPELDPTWDPHGRRIAFSRQVKGRFDLFACRRDGSGLVRLTNTPGADEFGAAWSPGNDQIAFARYEGPAESGSGDLWITSPDGRMERSLLGDEHDYGAPSWSPDARRLAFLMDGHVAVMDVEGGVPRPLTPAGALKETRPSWSPDGRRIAFTRDPGTILTINPDGSQPREVPFDGAANGVAWEPAG
jgi:Tol biopolymer transport system component